MSAAEQYEHLRSVFEAQIGAEAFKVSQYENLDVETATDAQSRWSDWAVLYDALGNGLMDRLKAEYASRRALTGGAV